MKQSMALADHAHFIGAWLRNPLQTGALWPSGQSRAPWRGASTRASRAR